MYAALENIRSLYNVGAIIRSCSFFGIKNLVLIGYSGVRILPSGRREIHEKVLKTALYYINDVEITIVEDADEFLEFTKKLNLEIVSIEQASTSIPIQRWQPSEKSIMVFGHELRGVSLEILSASSQVVEIPRVGPHGSLNVATSVGIAFYHVLNTSTDSS